MSEQLKQLISKLDLSKEKGVIFRATLKKWVNAEDKFSKEICSKLHKINPDAIYHFLNQPFILFFDRTEKSAKKTEREIFKEV